MLPNFPNFKKLELVDKEEIENISSLYEPYSDFDFTSLWSWNILDQFQIAILNGNLVLVLTDHFTEEQYLTFLGDKQVNETVQTILSYLVTNESYASKLRLVPEVVLKQIDFSKFIIEIDINNYDYIYDLSELASYEGPKYSEKRKLANKFIKNHPQADIITLNLKDPGIREQVLNLSKQWVIQKSSHVDNTINFDKELLAIQRFLDCDFDSAFAVGVSDKNEILGFEIFTLLKNNYAISHFSKIRPNHPGVYEFLASGYSKKLLEKDILRLNAEEDLGLPGLRFSKNSFRPISFLRKYTISSL